MNLNPVRAGVFAAAVFGGGNAYAQPQQPHTDVHAFHPGNPSAPAIDVRVPRPDRDAATATPFERYLAWTALELAGCQLLENRPVDLSQPTCHIGPDNIAGIRELLSPYQVRIGTASPVAYSALMEGVSPDVGFLVGAYQSLRRVPWRDHPGITPHNSGIVLCSSCHSTDRSRPADPRRGEEPVCHDCHRPRDPRLRGDPLDSPGTPCRSCHEPHHDDHLPNDPSCGGNQACHDRRTDGSFFPHADRQCPTCHIPPGGNPGDITRHNANSPHCTSCHNGPLMPRGFFGPSIESIRPWLENTPPEIPYNNLQDLRRGPLVGGTTRRTTVTVWNRDGGWVAEIPDVPRDRGGISRFGATKIIGALRRGGVNLPDLNYWVRVGDDPPRRAGDVLFSPSTRGHPPFPHERSEGQESVDRMHTGRRWPEYWVARPPHCPPFSQPFFAGLCRVDDTRMPVAGAPPTAGALMDGTMVVGTMDPPPGSLARELTGLRVVDDCPPDTTHVSVPRDSLGTVRRLAGETDDYRKESERHGIGMTRNPDEAEPLAVHVMGSGINLCLGMNDPQLVRRWCAMLVRDRNENGEWNGAIAGTLHCTSIRHQNRPQSYDPEIRNFYGFIGALFVLGFMGGMMTRRKHKVRNHEVVKRFRRIRVKRES